MIFKANWGFDW